MLHLFGRAAEVLACDVCAERQHPLHVVAVIFAERGPFGNSGYVAKANLPSRAPGNWDVLHLFERAHLMLGNLDLDLVADAAPGVGPVVSGGVAT